MSFSNIPRILPFSDWNEWIEIKNGLYSTSNYEKHNAIEMVNMLRLRGRLPHSIDLTAQLIEVQLKDHYNISFIKYSHNELKSLYSMLIIRCVNGLVDPNQQGIFATSVMTLAEKIGLPTWIVELRHDATHNQIPSISVLTTAINTLVTWYYENYWLPQQKFLSYLSHSCMPMLVLNYGFKDNEITILNRIKSPIFFTEIFLPIFFITINSIKTNYYDINEYKTLNDYNEFLINRFEIQSKFWLIELKKFFNNNLNTFSIFQHRLLCIISELMKEFIDIKQLKNINNKINFNINNINSLKNVLLKLKSIEFWNEIININENNVNDNNNDNNKAIRYYFIPLIPTIKYILNSYNLISFDNLYDTICDIEIWKNELLVTLKNLFLIIIKYNDEYQRIENNKTNQITISDTIIEKNEIIVNKGKIVFDYWKNKSNNKRNCNNIDNFNNKKLKTDQNNILNNNYNNNNNNNNSDSDNSNKGDKTNNIDNQIQSITNYNLNNISCIQFQAHSPFWSLGCIPGSFHTGYLYKIEECSLD